MTKREKNQRNCENKEKERKTSVTSLCVVNQAKDSKNNSCSHSIMEKEQNNEQGYKAAIHHFVRTNNVTKKYYTKDLQQYFINFEDKARRGLFEELNDVNLFIYRGTDKNGLTLWH